LQDDDYLFTVMPYCRGGSLEIYLQTHHQQSQHTQIRTNQIRVRPNRHLDTIELTSSTKSRRKQSDMALSMTTTDIPSSDCTVQTVSSDGTVTHDDISTATMFTVYEEGPEPTTSRSNTATRYSEHERTVREIFKQLLDALQHLQKKGVCHRNINPSNVLIEPDHSGSYAVHLRLIDFTHAVRIPYQDESNIGGVADISQGSNRLLLHNDTRGHTPTPIVRKRPTARTTTMDVVHNRYTGNAIRAASSRSPRVTRRPTTITQSSVSLSPTSRRNVSKTSFVTSRTTSSPTIPATAPTTTTIAATSLSFIAPELYEGRPYDGYTVDVWSVSVILYVLLVGTVPFEIANVEIDDAYRQINAGRLKQLVQQQLQQQRQEVVGVRRYRNHPTITTTTASRIMTLSDDVLDLLQQLFWYHPQDRLTSLSDIRQHPWMIQTTTTMESS
jgi:serine/threonine protein kinase